MQFYSQSWIGQDALVAKTLNFLKNGFFVDIGCHHYKDISNTYFFEKELNWRGLGIDIESKFEPDWLQHRPNSRFICGDGTLIDYQKELQILQAPNVIDYLTIDTEPPEITLKCLNKILETTYTFKTITFETESHSTGNAVRDESRKILTEKGYTLVADILGQDDFWVNYNVLSLSSC